ncbi:DUF4387 family protein [Pseudoroseomonas wenyumeiae]
MVDLAKVIRSKNAGPTHLTVDLMFHDPDGFNIAQVSPALTSETIAFRYGIDPNFVTVIPYRAANAIKIVIDRPIIAGTPGIATSTVPNNIAPCWIWNYERCRQAVRAESQPREAPPRPRGFRTTRVWNSRASPQSRTRKGSTFRRL